MSWVVAWRAEQAIGGVGRVQAVRGGGSAGSGEVGGKAWGANLAEGRVEALEAVLHAGLAVLTV